MAVNRLEEKEVHIPYRDEMVASLYRQAEAIARRVVRPAAAPPHRSWEEKLDDLLASPWMGFPAMLVLLGAALWITVVGANYPSQWLAAALFWGQDRLSELFVYLGAPAWLHGLLVLGVYRAVAWVVSVMLPPMAIFFPCFTLLEDLGYLPRVAFNLDNYFQRAGAHGKQALTMSMGLGCNAAGVVACRIIESPRERLIALLTNNFVPCNGRFPLLIALATVFLGSGVAGRFLASLAVVGMVLAGITVTLAVSWLLSRTLLRGVPSTFCLELPPFRRPRALQVIARSVFDRTLFVLYRALLVTAPAGAMIWLLGNLRPGGASVIQHLAGWLEPLARYLGLDGYILLSFFLALPANELVLPVLLMSYQASGQMAEYGSLQALGTVLRAQGWTWLTALCTMLFSVLHFPCGTTLLTIRKEAGHGKWALLAFVITLGAAMSVTFVLRQAAGLLGNVW